MLHMKGWTTAMGSKWSHLGCRVCRPPQSDASCQISIKPRAGAPARRKADPDYVPERSDSIWGSNPGSSTQRHGSDENIDASQVSNFRSSGRKPRTAPIAVLEPGVTLFERVGRIRPFPLHARR